MLRPSASAASLNACRASADPALAGHSSVSVVLTSDVHGCPFVGWRRFRRSAGPVLICRRGTGRVEYRDTGQHLVDQAGHVIQRGDRHARAELGDHLPGRHRTHHVQHQHRRAILGRGGRPDPVDHVVYEH
jgi:hypothetical protein